MNLTLCGCGRGSRLLLGENGLLECKDVGSLRIEQLLIQLDPKAQWIARGGREVTLEGIVVVGSSVRPADKPAPVVLHATTSLRVAASRFQFPNEELLSVGRMLTQLNSDLGDLFSDKLDDESFEAQRLTFSDRLLSLPAPARTMLTTGLSTALQSAKLADPLQHSLERFSTVLSPQPADRATVIGHLDDIRRAALRSRPALALVLEPAAGDVTLVDNQIVGLVSVYGEPGELDLTPEDMPYLARRASHGDFTFVPDAGRLSVVRNEVSRLVLADQMVRQLKPLTNVQVPRKDEIQGVFRAAYVAQNLFTAGRNRVLAQDVRLSDNVLEPVDTDLGAVIADTATYVGNGTVKEPGVFFNASRLHRPKNPDDLNTMTIKSGP